MKRYFIAVESRSKFVPVFGDFLQSALVSLVLAERLIKPRHKIAGKTILNVLCFGVCVFFAFILLFTGVGAGQVPQALQQNIGNVAVFLIPEGLHPVFHILNVLPAHRLKSPVYAALIYLPDRRVKAFGVGGPQFFQEVLSRVVAFRQEIGFHLRKAPGESQFFGGKAPKLAVAPLVFLNEAKIVGNCPQIVFVIQPLGF